MRKKELTEKLEEKEKKCDFSLHRVSKFVQPSVLLFLRRRPSYGYELIEKLKGLGFCGDSIDVGAVYRSLRKLEKDGFLKSSWQVKTGRSRRIYKITPEGRKLLRMWMGRIMERKEVLEKFITIYKGGEL